jgi:23S rRNA (cytidine1920-2'-O)/16S rRNA (cytidine1409-2'-O)-methyltransferase
VRIDRELVARGLVESRTKAHRLITDGHVALNGVVCHKASTDVGETDTLELLVDDTDVGRGAKKLRYALNVWHVPLDGAVCVDLGASTGGFSQVLLEAGASHVVAIDVGHGQLHPLISEDSRVMSVEGHSVLDITPDWWAASSLPRPVSVVVADLSFVSLQKVIPVAVECFGVDAHYVMLVKPQFEVGKGRTHHGVVKDIPRRDQSVRDVAQVFSSLGVTVRDVICSPMTGEHGNVEYLIMASNEQSIFPAEWDGHIPTPDQEARS